MFDRLVESTAHHEDSARKGWFFFGTFALYFVLFMGLLVFAIDQYDRSLSAQLGADMKLVTRVAEEPQPVKQPEKQEQQKQQTVKVEQQVATVRELVTDRPEVVAKGVSVTNKGQSPPVPGAVKGKVDYIPPSGGSPFGDPNASGPVSSGPPSPPVSDEPPPPPQPKPTPKPAPRAPISGGVLNGRAISLPKPSYPPIARAAHASGTVTVQVTIDESGKVISAKAVGGHPLLQQAAVQAAYGARFTPTQLSGQPVKVTGVITYNFVAQ